MEIQASGDRSNETASVVTHDFEHAGPKGLLPKGAIIVGEIGHFRETPSFTSVAVILSPEHDVLPGQFLCSSHGQRAETLTVIQVNDCIEVNPNELPELSVARARLGLGKSYAEEGVS